jgi:hypothetical protein
MAPVCVVDVRVERLLLAWRRGKRERRRWAAQQREHRSAGESGDRAAEPNAKDHGHPPDYPSRAADDAKRVARPFNTTRAGIVPRRASRRFADIMRAPQLPVV